MEDEIWKDINGYEGYYQISNYGNARSLDRQVGCRWGGLRDYGGKSLLTETTKDGYQRIVFMRDAIKERFLVHRIVAEAFIPNPENKPYVNHIDGDKSNNYFGNLEWCTNSENVLHADRNGLRDMSTHQPSNSKGVRCIDNGMEFASTTKAVKWLGRNKNSVAVISRAIKNDGKAYGYKWEYLTS